MVNHFVFDSVPQRPGTAKYGGGIAGRPCPETAGAKSAVAAAAENTPYVSVCGWLPTVTDLVGRKGVSAGTCSQRFQ